MKEINRKIVFWLLFVSLTAAFLIVLTGAKTANSQVETVYSFEVAFPNLTFNQPDGVFADPTGANRLFVTEQAGTIKVFNNTKNANTSTVFLDISDRVVFGGEQGLLGLAFHPNFNQNRYFYVNYVANDPLRTVIARYTVSASNPDVADPESVQVIMEYNQPFPNHKGGQLAFGPDGYLYIGVGDGGRAGDPSGNAQSRSTVLGKILRINADAPSAGRNYGIPSDNPYAGNTLGYREEIYAYGFRNPWRFSFDSATGQLWVGDVGQDRLEEIDFVERGKNYGWNIMEGSLCFDPAVGCDQTGLELPVWNYTRELGYSVIGGYVYRGSALPTLRGDYVYADYGSGRIWALGTNASSTVNTLLVNSGLNIASFGLDNQNELYFTAYDGKIYRLTSTAIPEIPIATGVLLTLATLAVLAVLARVISKKLRVNTATNMPQYAAPRVKPRV